MAIRRAGEHTADFPSRLFGSLLGQLFTMAEVLALRPEHVEYGVADGCEPNATNFAVCPDEPARVSVWFSQKSRTVS